MRGLEPLPEDELSTERYGMPAPQNLTGVLERNVMPGMPNPTARGEFQLEDPGGLTLPSAQPPSLLRRSMVEGMPDVGPPPEPPPRAKGLGWAQPQVDPLDAYDQSEAQRMQRTRRGLGIAGIVSALFGDSRTNDARTQALQQAAQANDPNAPIQRMNERHAAAAASAAEQAQQAYEREMQDRRFDLDERRIAQAEGATSQDQDRAGAMYDPEHPAAQSARIAYARLYRAIPPSALPQLSAFQPDRSLQGMSAMDIRQQAASLTQAWGRLQQANPNLFRVGRRSAGGRTARNGLAGLGSPSRTVDYGVSEGLTPEDWQVLGVDPAAFGGEPAQPLDDVGVQEEPAAPPPGPSQMRVQPPRTGAQGMGGGMRPTQQAAMRPPPAQSQAVPQGRPLVDRPMTNEELAVATPEVRRTQLLAQAQQRRAIGMSWQDAVATVQGFQPAERDRLMAEYGNEGANRIPGWRRVRDTGVLPPNQYTDMRETVTQARQIRANARRIQQIANEVRGLNLAEDQLHGHPLVTEWRSLARRIQTALRVIDRTGVPTGNEQERAMQEAPEPDSIQALLRASTAYSTLPDAIDRNVWQYMDTLGYRPEGRRRTQQGGQ